METLIAVGASSSTYVYALLLAGLAIALSGSFFIVSAVRTPHQLLKQHSYRRALALLFIGAATMILGGMCGSTVILSLTQGYLLLLTGMGTGLGSVLLIALGICAPERALKQRWYRRVRIFLLTGAALMVLEGIWGLIT